MPDLNELESEIKAAKKQQALADEPGDNRLNATRMSVELVAGVLVGSFMGYHIDAYFETSPIFFIICFFLGVAGGALNLYKLATSTDDTESN